MNERRRTRDGHERDGIFERFVMAHGEEGSQMATATEEEVELPALFRQGGRTEENANEMREEASTREGDGMFVCLR